MSLKVCPNCGQENPAEAEFCAMCSMKIPSKGEGVGSEPQDTGNHVAREKEVIEAGSDQDRPADFSEPAKPQPAPSSFGERYKILDILGSGRLGTVYHVVDKAFERDLAIRLIKGRPDVDQSAIDRAVHDFKLEPRIVHKNVGRIFDFGTEKGNLFLTMEYCPGKELHLLLMERGRLPFQTALDLAKQLSRGLAECHRLGALHLDLRPGNVMIDAEGTARIMDLGIVRFLQKKGILAPDFNERWPEYLSPEQVQGWIPDERSDLYSLGLVLYEIFTGQPAFSARTPAELARKKLNETPRAPRLANPLISEELNLLILRCLETDPQRRWASARELNAELESMESARIPPQVSGSEIAVPVEAAQTKKKTEAEKPPEKKKKRTRQPWDWKALMPLKRAVGIGLVALAATAAVLFWRSVFGPGKRGQPAASSVNPPTIAVLPLGLRNETAEKQDWADGLTELIIRNLKKIDSVFIPGCDSSFFAKERIPSDREIGLKLGVDHLVKAVLEKRDDVYLIEAEVISPAEGSAVSAIKLERAPADFHDLLIEFCREIIKSTGASGSTELPSFLFADLPRTIEASDLYVEARSLLRKGGREDLEKALAKLQNAARREPTSATVQAALGEAYVRLGLSGFWEPSDAFPKAKIPVLTAIELNPDSAEARTLLGMIKATFDWDFAEAERQFQLALRQEPNFVPAMRFYADLLSSLGRHEEAVETMKRARAGDPLSPSLNAGLGAVLYFARRYDLATEELQSALRSDPLNGEAHLFLGLVFIQTQRVDLAAASLKKAIEFGADPVDVGLRLGYLSALDRRREEAGKALTEAMRASQQRYVSSVSMAAVYAALFEKEQAIACLENALKERDPQLRLIKVHPQLDFLRREPWFVSLLGKLGFEKPAT